LQDRTPEYNHDETYIIFIQGFPNERIDAKKTVIFDGDINKEIPGNYDPVRLNISEKGLIKL
jgi:hypothetical protein